MDIQRSLDTLCSFQKQVHNQEVTLVSLHLQVSLTAFLISQVDVANHKHLRFDKNRGRRKEWRMENKNNMVHRWCLWHPVSLKMDSRGEMDTTSPSVRGEKQRQMRREMWICQHVHKPFSLWRPTSTFSLPSHTFPSFLHYLIKMSSWSLLKVYLLF